TFLIYHTYWDNSCITVYSLNNKSYKRLFDETYEQVGIDILGYKSQKGWFGINLRHMYVHREITSILTKGVINTDYDSPFNYIIERNDDNNNDIGRSLFMSASFIDNI